MADIPIVSSPLCDEERRVHQELVAASEALDGSAGSGPYACLPRLGRTAETLRSLAAFQKTLLSDTERSVAASKECITDSRVRELVQQFDEALLEDLTR